jgi:hypothetical protein
MGRVWYNARCCVWWYTIKHLPPGYLGRGVLTRLKRVCSVAIHPRREASHNVLCLAMEIPHHGVAMPATHEANVVHVDLAKEHGAALAQQPHTDVTLMSVALMPVRWKLIRMTWRNISITCFGVMVVH